MYTENKGIIDISDQGLYFTIMILILIFLGITDHKIISSKKEIEREPGSEISHFFRNILSSYWPIFFGFFGISMYFIFRILRKQNEGGELSANQQITLSPPLDFLYV